MLEILSDPSLTGLAIVATAEEMPVSETIELQDRIRSETTVDLAAIIVNRVLPELFARGEEEVFDRLSEPDAMEVLDDALGGPAQPLFEGARMAVTLRRTRTSHLERLRAGIDASIPLLYVPEMFARSHGLRLTHQIADAVSAELGY
jgi:anion-transporting  ArsA/GET3 family ATPase